MTHGEHDSGSRFPVPAAILGVALLYVAALIAGGPQWGTQQSVPRQAAHGGASDAHPAPVAATEGPPIARATSTSPPFWTVFPFVLLLAGIAVLPLIPATAHWWESNLHRFHTAVGL